MRKQIIFSLVSRLFAFCDQFVNQVEHIIDVFLELLLRAHHQFVLDAKSLRLAHRFIQSPHHLLDERMGILTVKAIEAVIEPAQADRIERQSRHVIRHIDFLVRVEPCPFLHQLRRKVNHFLVIAFHRLLAEARQQDIMGFLPVRLFGSAREQAVSAERTDFLESRPYLFIKARLVTDFRCQFRTRNERAGTSRKMELIDRPKFTRLLHERLHRFFFIDQWQIAKRAIGFRLWKVFHLDHLLAPLL